MKNVILAIVISCSAIMITSCGGSHGSCAAYHKTDYTKYKEEKKRKDLSQRQLKRKMKQANKPKTKLRSRKKDDIVYLPKFKT